MKLTENMILRPVASILAVLLIVLLVLYYQSLTYNAYLEGLAKELEVEKSYRKHLERLVEKLEGQESYRKQILEKSIEELKQLSQKAKGK